MTAEDSYPHVARWVRDYREEMASSQVADARQGKDARPPAPQQRFQSPIGLLS